MEVTFIGAAGTVTGSKTLITEGSTRILIDSGLFQGVKLYRLRNRMPLPVSPDSLDAVILTHAHIDHCGYLPKLVRDGFKGPVHCTAPTRDLCGILLPDSGHIQEEDAKYLNKKGLSRHKPAVPLYTEKDGKAALKHLEPHPFDEEWKVGPLSFRFKQAGHILGAATVMVGSQDGTLCVSGDLGRPDMPLMVEPDPFEGADWVLLESTYGDRLHADIDPVKELAAVVVPTLGRGGILMIPSFAVGRAQAILYCIHRIFKENMTPRVPMYIDSPMATDVTELYYKYPDFHRLEQNEVENVCRQATFVNSVDESKRLNRRKGPFIIIASSGMMTGGRIMHHVKAHGGDPGNTICLAGYQAPGTRGADIAAGAKSVKVHREYIPINAEVVQLDSFSAHADQGEILQWLGTAGKKPERVFLNHGEPASSDALRRRIQETMDCRVRVVEYRDSVTLSPAERG